MKIRTDFVTNSSSSSFVLAFKDESSVKHELLDCFPEWAIQDFGIVWRDIKDAERLTIDDLKSKIEDYFEVNAKYSIFDFERYRNPDLKYSDMDKWYNQDGGKEKVEKFTQKVIDGAIEKVGNKSVIVELEYGNDNGYGEIEHSIIPHMKDCLVVTFNHH